ncbi:PhnD/SsuA/transferrin family substrate-binding protein [Geobacter pelophilus]|uniref:PhnD/SsuA/transferrin family substrate-binding protein n=1 Tax=Geoanaerobacter pelophilus TaxID=60036 RepID=A0AAW4L8P1_9BACT|nr:phosphate/phosphite/phosphonate ABC transporter substrate-binding protein [Geoanaerobacter pelophilus]MBT0665930.1 PhnD/SsuA/transferrin family substrate-binding protein [Geoanaerobacter pelophilus]
MTRLIAVITLLLVACTAFAAQDEVTLKLGVLAYRPKPQALAQWQPVAEYLRMALKQPVELAVYDYTELADVAKKRSTDVVITTASHFVLLKQTCGFSSPLATMVSRMGTHELSTYGGVIIARSDRGDITSLADLSDKKIATVATDAFGGFQMQEMEMVEAGLPMPPHERLVITGQPHDKVIEAVLAGRADVGFARAGVIEGMIREGKLDPERLKIINRRNAPHSPFVVSTRLYPEWPVAVLPHVESELAARLAAALFLLPRNSLTGPAATISGFTVPANYDGVEHLLRKLRLPPFDRPPEFTLADLWKRHAPWIVTLGGLLLLLSVASAGLIVLYRRANRSLREVERLAEKERLLLASLAEGVYGVDAWERCIFVNPAALTMLGFAASELIEVKIHDLFHRHTESGLPNHPEACPVLHTLRDGVKREAEVTFTRKDGSMFPVSLVASAMKQGTEIVGVVVAFQDITRHKQAEEALMQRTYELDQEIAERQVAQESLQEQALLLEKEMEERRAAQNELEQANERLEQRVRERTAELEAKNADLQNMLKSYVGRELKMVELKERIKALEAKI